MTYTLAIGIAIVLPLGIFVARYRKFAEPIIGITAVFQTIPSLALFGFLVPHGTNEIFKTAFRVPSDAALDYWVKRFDRLEVKHTGI